MSPNNKRINLVIIIVMVLVVISGAGLLTFKLMNQSEKRRKLSKEDETVKEPIEEEIEIKNSVNILLVGSDVKYQQRNRADTIMVASISLEDNKAGIISIPRDTRVRFSDQDKYHKINAAYAYGGVELIQQTLEQLLSIKIDHYLELDYNGFIEVVDTLGGVEINLEKDLYYVDQADDLYINLKAGRQRLSGEDALGYVRFRHDALGDIGRIKRQQKFLKALFNEALSLGTVLKLPQLIGDISNNVSTDLRFSQMLQVASSISDFNLEEIQMEMLPGEPQYIAGISYWIPFEEETRVLVNTLIRNKSYLNHKELELVILNGIGEAGIARNIAGILEKQGYKIKGLGNADHFNYNKSVVIAPEDQRDKLTNLVNYLNSDFIIDNDSDVRVIIGENIKEIKEKQGFLT